MNPQQIILSAVLATMMFSIALDLRLRDFQDVAKKPIPILCGLIAQFLFLPAATWGVTLLVNLPPNVEAGMLLVAACPCGSLSNFVTHYGRGNTALSVSITGVASLLALFLTPFNFSWTVATNPATATWLKSIAVDPSAIWVSLIFMLGIPLVLGLACQAYLPLLTAKIKQPLGVFGLAALGLFILAAVIKDHQMLWQNLGFYLVIVVLHNALGLSLGYGSAWLTGLSVADRRAVTVEVGMQNSGLALGIIGAQFGGDFGMLMMASLWGIWHIVSGFTLAMLWRSRRATPLQGAASHA